MIDLLVKVTMRSAWSVCCCWHSKSGVFGFGLYKMLCIKITANSFRVNENENQILFVHFRAVELIAHPKMEQQTLMNFNHNSLEISVSSTFYSFCSLNHNIHPHRVTMKCVWLHRI